MRALSASPQMTELGVSVDMLGGSAEGSGQDGSVSLRFKKTKCWVLPLGLSNTLQLQVGGKVAGKCPVGKNLGVLVNSA